MKKTFFGLLTALLALNGVSAYAGSNDSRASKESRGGNRAGKESNSGRVSKEACGHKGGKGCGCGGKAKENSSNKADSSGTAAN